MSVYMYAYPEPSAGSCAGLRGSGELHRCTRAAPLAACAGEQRGIVRGRRGYSLGDRGRDDFAEFRRASKCKQRLTPHTWYWVQPIGSVGTSYVHVYADWSPRTDNSPNAEMVSKGVNSGRHAVNGCDNRKPSFKTGRGMTPNYSETKGNALV